MMEQLDGLYREVILDHFKNPRNSGALTDAAIREEGSNPLCGDEMIFFANVDGDRLTDVRFTGKGCAISQATASMLSEQLEGKTFDDVARLINRMKALMQGQDLDASDDVGDLESLAGVRKFPVRIKCAALSWNLVEQAVQQYREDANGRH